jgi:hypothetical protein
MPPRSDLDNSSPRLVVPDTQTLLKHNRENFSSIIKEEDVLYLEVITSCNSYMDVIPSNVLHNHQGQLQQLGLPRVVSFCDDVSILEFPYTLGDNPACSSGAPITIDWTPQCRYNVSLQQQQQQRLRRQQEQVGSGSASALCHNANDHRQCRNKKSSFSLTAQQRYDRLVQSGISSQDIRHANRQRQRLRQQRQATVDYIELDETIQIFVTLAHHTKKKMVKLLKRRR